MRQIQIRNSTNADSSGLQIQLHKSLDGFDETNTNKI